MASITLVKCTDENNKVLKTPDLTTSVALTGIFRADISVLNPVFRIESIEDLTGYNYCYIADFSRWYFITDISIVRNGMYEFKCKVDVLFTYSTEIYALKAVIKRQQEKYNLYVNDNNFVTYNYDRVQAKAFPSGFSGHYYFVLTTAGKAGVS